MLAGSIGVTPALAIRGTQTTGCVAEEEIGSMGIRFKGLMTATIATAAVGAVFSLADIEHGRTSATGRTRSGASGPRRRAAGRARRGDGAVPAQRVGRPTRT